MTGAATPSVQRDAPGRAQALRIVEALRKGGDCLERASSFSAGRVPLIKAATDLFMELEISGGAVVRWVRGRTGQGKTNFFANLIEIAHLRNWVTSYVVVSERGYGIELHHFERVYAAIVRNCLCRDLVADVEGRVEPGRFPGWEWILNGWWIELRRLAAGGHMGEIPSFRAREIVNQAITSLRLQWGTYGGFTEALRQYALARADDDEDWAQILCAWFRGEDVHSLGGDTKARLIQAGIREPLARRNAKEMLRSLSAFLKYRGFDGLLILFDELENVLHQPPAARRTAYTTLRELADNVDDVHGMTNTAFYISATPDVFDSEKGLIEYEALAGRVLMPAGQTANPAGVVIDLAAWPLSQHELMEIANNITVLHGTAKQWIPGKNAIDRIHRLLGQRLHGNLDMSTRDWVRAVVRELDDLYGEKHNVRP